jgi:hypothetical protein
MALKRTTVRRLSRLRRTMAPVPEIDTSGMTPQEQVMYDMDRYGLEAMVLALPPLEMDRRPQSVAVEPPPSSPPAKPAPAAPTEPPAPPLWHEEYVRWRTPGEPLPDYFMEDLDEDEEEDDEDCLWRD